MDTNKEKALEAALGPHGRHGSRSDAGDIYRLLEP